MILSLAFNWLLLPLFNEEVTIGFDGIWQYDENIQNNKHIYMNQYYVDIGISLTS